MNKIKVLLLLLGIMFLLVKETFSQAIHGHLENKSVELKNINDSTIEALKKIKSNYTSLISKKSRKLEKRLHNRSVKALKNMVKFEKSIGRDLEKSNPEIYRKLFSTNQNTFSSIYSKLKNKDFVVDSTTTNYSLLDIKSKVSFIDEVTQNSKEYYNDPKVEKTKELEKLHKKILKNEHIEKLIAERKKKLILVNGNISATKNSLKKIQKEYYYYTESLINYRKIFKKTKNVEKQIAQILNKIPEYEKFSNAYLQHKKLFASGRFVNSQDKINGLPSRSNIQEYIEKSFSIEASKINQQFTEILKGSESQINHLKSLSSAVSSIDSVGFKPNHMRSKTFRQRLEFGVDLNFEKSKNYFPATTDLGLKVGYRVNNDFIFGIGLNYKMGLGSGWNKVKFTNEGIGVRSYIKQKVFKNWDLQGGYELNYFLQFKSLQQLKNLNKWQQSFPVGISKSYFINSKLNGNIQLLFDCLSGKNFNHSQPFIFRVGYDF